MRKIFKIDDKVKYILNRIKMDKQISNAKYTHNSRYARVYFDFETTYDDTM